MKISKIATFVVMFIMISVFILDIVTVLLCNKYEKTYQLTAETFDGGFGADKIHFLNTNNSDAILLESDGHFGLIDSGEGSNNPNLKARTDGFEDKIISYLKKTAGDSEGRVHLDFVLATHYHYDHIGGFQSILRDEYVYVERAYFRRLSEGLLRDYEKGSWQIPQLYAELIDTVKERGIELVQDLPKEPFKFGSFTLQFFNTDVVTDPQFKGDNDDSVGVKVTKGDRSAFLSADISNAHGLEKKLADSIGEVDILKLGHHGYAGASSAGFVRTLRPKIAIVTNWLGKIYPNVKWNLTMYSHSAIYSTVKCDGIAACFTDEGEIRLTTHLHTYYNNN
ncbi:MAG: hypothetical protein K5756_02115 [Clostridiales bacterium]|nr:hypothetical protein [Clostridiales bacterium]